MKTYLNVPYGENGEARLKGAKFDLGRKQWYCPDGVDLRLFAKWLPSELAKFWGKLERGSKRRGTKSLNTRWVR